MIQHVHVLFNQALFLQILRFRTVHDVLQGRSEGLPVGHVHNVRNLSPRKERWQDLVLLFAGENWHGAAHDSIHETVAAPRITSRVEPILCLRQRRTLVALAAMADRVRIAIGVIFAQPVANVLSRFERGNVLDRCNHSKVVRLILYRNGWALLANVKGGYADAGKLPGGLRQLVFKIDAVALVNVKQSKRQISTLPMRRNDNMVLSLVSSEVF
jgi:hypothetical protein